MKLCRLRMHALSTYPQCLPFGEIQQPFALLVVVDQEAGVDEKESVLEGFVEGALFEQDSLLDGVGEIKGKRSLSSSGHFSLSNLKKLHRSFTVNLQEESSQ